MNKDDTKVGPKQIMCRGKEIKLLSINIEVEIKLFKVIDGKLSKPEKMATSINMNGFPSSSGTMCLSYEAYIKRCMTLIKQLLESSEI